MAKDENQDASIEAMKTLVALSEKRTKMSAMRTYMNAERTLSVWVRTALSSMIFGIAIDRLGLMLHDISTHPQGLFGHPSTPTTLAGAALVLFSIVMSLTAGIRFIAFASHYRKEFELPYHHKGWLPVTYAFMIVFFGLALIILMWWIG